MRKVRRGGGGLAGYGEGNQRLLNTENREGERGWREKGKERGRENTCY